MLGGFACEGGEDKVNGGKCWFVGLKEVKVKRKDE